MPDEIRMSRPQGGMRPDQPMMQQMPGGEMMDEPKSSKAPWVILAVVVIVVLVLGLIFRDKLFKGSGTATTGKASGYQAVFLTNGQVYFGKLSEAKSEYLTLSDIYYLQVVQPPLQGNQSAAGGTAAQAAQPQISLVKLGNELHGPVDEMHISRAQVLFYEDLKDDGNVVKAIKDYKANPAGTPAK